MSLHHNPKIVTDGLVFGYDMDNVAKSFKGKPTTNLTTNTPTQAGWQGNYSLVSSDTKTFDVTTQQNNSSTTSAWRTWYWDVSSYEGSTITISGDVQFLEANDAEFLHITIGQGNTGSFPVHIAGSSAADKVQISTRPDQKIHMTWTGTINSAGLVGFTQWINNVTADGGNSTLRISNIQIEVSGFETPFVNGTRSNTQALLDMSKSKNTITATSLTYNSDGTFEFNNNNYLSLNTGITGSNFTVLMWHYNGASSFATAGHRTFLSTNNLRFQWDDTPDRGPFVDFNSGSGGGQANFGSSLTPANFLQKYTMVGLVGGSTVKTTFNGVTSGQSSTISATRNFSSNGNVSIGIDNLSGIGGSDHINREGSVVKMPLIQIYDRALTEAEIKQNFNATRGRFGI